MNQIARFDWLPERARWSYLARWGLPAVSRSKISSKAIVAYGGCARSTSGVPNLIVLLKRHNNSIFQFEANKSKDNPIISLASSNN